MLRILESKISNEVSGDKMLVKVSSKGLITLPKGIRDELGIAKGDYLAVSADEGRIVFQKVKVEIDWENSDEIWKEYAAKKLAEE